MYIFLGADAGVLLNDRVHSCKAAETYERRSDKFKILRTIPKKSCLFKKLTGLTPERSLPFFSIYPFYSRVQCCIE